jgi:hypothetical protein
MWIVPAAAIVWSCGDGGTSPYGRTTHVAGTVIPVASVYLTGPVQLTVRTGSAPGDTAIAIPDSTGAYQIDVRVPPSASDSVDLVIDAPPGTTRVYHPVLARMPASELQRALTRPLVVGRLTGHYTPTFGANVRPVSLIDAFTRVCPDSTSAVCDSFYPRSWLTRGVDFWTHGAAPIPVAFDRTHSTSTITAADSVAFWAAASRMSDDLGWPVFKPATILSPGAIDVNGTIAGAVLVVVDGTLAAGGEAIDRYDQLGFLNAARVRVPRESDLATQARVTHVLFHALGFGHTCAWPSVMGGYGCAASDSLTAQDAAGWALADQISGTQLIFAPTTGLAASLRGERELERPE